MPVIVNHAMKCVGIGGALLWYIVEESVFICTFVCICKIRSRLQPKGKKGMGSEGDQPRGSGMEVSRGGNGGDGERQLIQ